MTTFAPPLVPTDGTAKRADRWSPAGHPTSSFSSTLDAQGQVSNGIDSRHRCGKMGIGKAVARLLVSEGLARSAWTGTPVRSTPQQLAQYDRARWAIAGHGWFPSAEAERLSRRERRTARWACLDGAGL